MDAGLLAQYVAVALAVLLSAAYVAKRQFPNAVRRLRIALAAPLVREGRPRWLVGLGRAIAPPARAGADGCGGCSACEPTPPRR
ncbi:DUF6587 family protein [Vulcaniibacterium tengchongense]|uniref:Uncharacterized protein n=1 Tax=Vulcaniibacterium tengchongense TaxID=1273429 RepID=A0A3N4VJV4_9GAMM|nr:DUF6587 family protein [Vulcaniibacterium tengchongense]RPE81983.1 hypothetical protein EDC50_1186 [Vulcaniibacterium tengchongense]